MDNAIVGFQYRNPPCVRQFTRSFLRHNHVVVVALIPSAPGVARRAAQPRTLWHNAVGVRPLCNLINGLAPLFAGTCAMFGTPLAKFTLQIAYALPTFMRHDDT